MPELVHHVRADQGSGEQGRDKQQNVEPQSARAVVVVVGENVVRLGTELEPGWLDLGGRNHCRGLW